MDNLLKLYLAVFGIIETIEILFEWIIILVLWVTFMLSVYSIDYTASDDKQLLYQTESQKDQINFTALGEQE